MHSESSSKKRNIGITDAKMPHDLELTRRLFINCGEFPGWISLSKGLKKELASLPDKCAPAKGGSFPGSERESHLRE
jgi:hypothetical protein